MGQERLPEALSQWRPGIAKRRRGRCRTRWIDAVERDAKLAGMDQDLESMAADRAQWRDMLTLLVSKHHVAKMMMMMMISVKWKSILRSFVGIVFQR